MVEIGDRISIDRFKSKSNIRTDIDKQDLSELMESIRQHGLLQPIGVWKIGDEYVVSYGHRRLQAMKKLGYEFLEEGAEFKLLDGLHDKQTQILLNTTENIIRKDIDAIELGKVCYELKHLGFNADEIAARFGVSKSRIETALDLFEATPEEYRNSIGFSSERSSRRQGKIPATLAQRIVNSHISPATKKSLLKYAQENSLSDHDLTVVLELLIGDTDVEEALKFKDDFQSVTVHLAVKKDELVKLEHTRYNYFNSLSNFIKAIILGKVPPQPDLIWARLSKIRGAKAKAK